MPYIFATLVVINAAVFGYFVMVHEPNDQAQVLQVESELVNPIAFKNTTEHVPPLIGTKK